MREGEDRREEGERNETERISLTTKPRAFTDRCTYVYVQRPVKKKSTGIIHYDSSFRNNNEVLRAATPSSAPWNSTFGARRRGKGRKFRQRERVAAAVAQRVREM